MFRTIFYGAVLGSLVFAATETLVHAGTTKVLSPVPPKFRIKHDATRTQTAPELGFVVDILDMQDWKKLRRSVEQPSFSSLMDEESVESSHSTEKTAGGS